MSAGIDSIKASDHAEYHRIRQNLGVMRFGHKVRTKRRIAKAILLDGWWTYNGRFCDPVLHNVGAGVYDVSAKEYEGMP